MDRDRRTRSTPLKRKGSTLQTSVEVLRCKFGKPAAAAEGTREFTPSKQWTPIFYAVYHQREAALSHFLRAGGSPDDVNGTGQPPLCIAVANGFVETATILLDAGADVNAATKNGGETALHIAIKNGRTDLIDLILPYGPNLEVKTYETGETPLHYAASKSGSLAIVMTLLNRGASYDALNASGQTPAEAAMKANNIHGAVAIINAAHGKRNRLVKEKEMLLKYVQKTQGRFSIGNDLIADIFAAACDPESTVLVEAIKRNDAGLVEMFLEKGSDPDRETAKGFRPIFVALECAGAPVVKALLKRNPDVSVRDRKGQNVLQATFKSPLAQEKEAMSVIFGAFLEEGADATVTYPDGKTLLHHTVSPRFSHTKVAHLLIAAGAKINTPDNDGNTALHLATHSKSCVDLLLKNGANPRQLNQDRLTPLLYAITHGKKEKEPDLESLIKASDIRKTNADAQTALHVAAANGLENTVRLLLRARADTTVVDTNKHTPLLLAAKNHQWAIVPLLTIPPSINSWDEGGMSALHHIASSVPKAPSTWKDVATAIVPFCERGVSRSMRDRSGATPLIVAVKALPEEGLPVIEALLQQKADRRASWNCASHEDHKKRDALYYTATMGKAVFVDALLKGGAVFTFENWVPGRTNLGSTVQDNKPVMKLFAQHEWARRAGSLRRLSGGPGVVASPFSTVFPLQDLQCMIKMGLDVSALPKSPLGGSLLWAVLRHIPIQPPMSPRYILDVLKLVLDAGADPNAGTSRGSRRSVSPRSAQASKESLPLPLHPLTFVLEESPGIGIDVVTLLLTKGAKLSVASPFYGGRFPLHSAMKAHRVDIVDEFLLQRAEINCNDQNGRTPLYIAAESGDWEITDALLLRGAKLDIHDCEKNTPMHAAAIGGNKRIVATLLRAGAKANVKNEKGLTPLGCVAEDLDEKEKSKIVLMLRDAEEKERRECQYREKQEKQNEAQEAKMKQRKEEEEAKERQQRKEQDEKERRMKESVAAQRQKEQELATATTQQAAKPSPPSPPLTHKKSSLFKRSTSFFTKSKPHLPIPSPTTLPKHSSSILSLRINTPPTPTTTTTTRPPPNPTFPTTPNVTTPQIQPHPHKRLPSPRVDSGISAHQPNTNLTSQRNTLDLDLEAVNDKLLMKRESGTELKDWLALSRMLDGL
ncbi:ankyrin [Decorospora gaudefroyi]|uniref:Ankyrin n=1 Tax=Decorospora gaudefroyi TaxID=184978 RepID=A0A6A5KGK7_9PLEO|nr:ankyrin [Decorospora gaudefroyi]